MTEHIDDALKAVQQYLINSFPDEEISQAKPKDGLSWEFSVVRNSAAAHTVRIMRRFIDDHPEVWVNRLTGWNVAQQMGQAGAATVIVDTNGVSRENAS